MISGLTTFYRLHDGGCDYEVPVDVINYFQSRIAELEPRLALAEKVVEVATRPALSPSLVPYCRLCFSPSKEGHDRTCAVAAYWEGAKP